MQSRIPDPPDKSGSGKAKLFALILLVVLCSSAFALVTMTDFLGSSTPDNTVATTYDYTERDTLRIILSARPNDSALQSVYVKTALGTEYQFGDAGTNVEVMALHNESVRLITVRNNTHRVAQTIPIEKGFTPDVLVASDGSGEYRSIQAAINESAAGTTIAVRQGTYTEAVTVDKPVTLIVAPGTTVTPPSGEDALTVTHDGATVTNFPSK